LDENELEEAKDLKEAAVVLGASTAGAKAVKSGSGGSKGEKPSIEGELLEAAVKEAEGMFAKEFEAEKEAKKVSAVTFIGSGCCM
jgi:beta-ring hydroxylase